MSLKSDAMEFKVNEKRLMKREGSPTGTHFVVVILLMILVLVAMYFVATHMSEAEMASPTLAQI